jgi:hypothetical protein
MVKKNSKGSIIDLEERRANRLALIEKLSKKHNKIAELYRDEDEDECSEDEES